MARRFRAPILRFRRQVVLGLVLTAGSPSCQTLDFVDIPEAKDWNLTQLHEQDGSYRYKADVVGDVEYFFRFALGGFLSRSKDSLQSPKATRVEDIPDVTLRNVIELAEFSSEDPRIAALQAEWFSRLAIDDPWVLVRERCVLELGDLSKRLGLDALPGVPKPEEVSSPELVEVALTGLVQSARTPILEGRKPTVTERSDLSAGCDVVRDLVLDVDGGRRALRVVKELLRAGDVSEEFQGPLDALTRDLTRDLAGQAMARAVQDPEDVVRAAALESIVRSTGTTLLDDLVLQMRQESSPIVLSRLMQLVRQKGLPPRAEGVSEEEDEVRIRRLHGAIMEAALAHPEGQVRANAMLCLDAVTEDGPGTLREEDWLGWWEKKAAEASRAAAADSTANG